MIIPQKYTWIIQTVDWLGFQIRPKHIEIDPNKVKAIIKQPKPKNFKDVRGFLRFINFNRLQIEGYSKIVTLLMDLTKKGEGFKQDIA